MKILSDEEARARIDKLEGVNPAVMKVLWETGPVATWPKHLQEEVYRFTGMRQVLVWIEEGGVNHE